MNYKQITIEVPESTLDLVTDMLSAFDTGGFVVESREDFLDFIDNNRGRWDFVDENLYNSYKNMKTSRVLVYISRTEEGEALLRQIKIGCDRIISDNGNFELLLSENEVKEDDWAHCWKKYYKPTKVGKNLVICPSWEKYDKAENEIVIKIDPGMAFGTGTHETTRLCLSILEKYLKKGNNILDIGSGSGILSVASLLLGAQSAVAIDIDPTAVIAGTQNAKLNGVDNNLTVIQGDLVSKVKGKYDIVIANIVADVIISLTPEVHRYLNDGGLYLISGIIDIRENDIIECINSYGYRIIERCGENDWVCFALTH